jgi:hypothetical protein
MKIYPIDLAKSKIKKSIFISLGIIVFLLNLIILSNISMEKYYLRNVISALFTILSLYFALPVIFLSYINPIFLFKNKIIAILFPFIFCWSSFIVHLLLNGTFKALIISLFLSSIGFIFSGLLPINKNKILYYINLSNYLFSRLMFCLFSAFLLIEIFKIIFALMY